MGIAGTILRRYLQGVEATTESNRGLVVYFIEPLLGGGVVWAQFVQLAG